MSVSGTKRPVFIVGCSRSGTTLLHASLASSKEIFTFPETQLPFSFLGTHEPLMFGVERDSTPRTNKIRNRLLEILQENGICRNNYVYQVKRMRQQDLGVPLVESRMRKFVMQDAFSFYRSAIEEICKPNVWLEKSPRNIFILRFIEKYIPDAKFIHVVRPGEDTVASLVDAGRRYPAFYNRFGQSDGILRAVLYWNNAIRETYKRKGNGRHLIVAYHDLVDDPAKECRKICSFIEVQYSQRMIEPKFEAVSNSFETWKFKHGNKISRSHSKFDTLFSAQEKHYILARLAMTPHQVLGLATP